MPHFNGEAANGEQNGSNGEAANGHQNGSNGDSNGIPTTAQPAQLQTAMKEDASEVERYPANGIKVLM